MEAIGLFSGNKLVSKKNAAGDQITCTQITLEFVNSKLDDEDILFLNTKFGKALLVTLGGTWRSARPESAVQRTIEDVIPVTADVEVKTEEVVEATPEEPIDLSKDQESGQDLWSTLGEGDVIIWTNSVTGEARAVIHVENIVDNGQEYGVFMDGKQRIHLMRSDVNEGCTYRLPETPTERGECMSCGAGPGLKLFDEEGYDYKICAECVEKNKPHQQAKRDYAEVRKVALASKEDTADEMIALAEEFGDELTAEPVTTEGDDQSAVCQADCSKCANACSTRREPNIDTPSEPASELPAIGDIIIRNANKPGETCSFLRVVSHSGRAFRANNLHDTSATSPITLGAYQQFYRHATDAEIAELEADGLIQKPITPGPHLMFESVKHKKAPTVYMITDSSEVTGESVLEPAGGGEAITITRGNHSEYELVPMLKQI